MPKRNLTLPRPPKSDFDKRGWRIREWGDATGLSRSTIFNMMKDGRIAFVKCGRSTILTTTPTEFLAALGDQ